jgi:hypothetical protein
MISGERFVAFAKAYINVMVLYRHLRAPPTTTVSALVLVEWALRSSNAGQNDPALFTRETFVRAENALMSGTDCESVRYDTGRELEMMAGMLQGGYHSKTFRFGTHGFGLVGRPFRFSSSIPQPRSRKSRQLDLDVQSDSQAKRLPNEVVAAVGLAYRSAVERFGAEHEVTAMAALTALPFTTTSMRLSDLVELRADALRPSGERVRLAIYRPKTDTYQDIPVPRRLELLAQELIKTAANFSAPARTAFRYYIENFANFESIDRLYVPSELRCYFERTHFRRPRPGPRLPEDEGSFSALELEARAEPSLCDSVGVSCYSRLASQRGVDAPGDFFPPKEPREATRGLYLSVKDLRFVLRFVGLELPDEIENLEDEIYVELEYICCAVPADETQLLGIELAFHLAGRQLGWFSRVKDLHDNLLADFKSQKFPHWPYTSKDRKLRLDEALCLTFDNKIDQTTNVTQRKRTWWRPTRNTRSRFLRWIDTSLGNPPILFATLEVRLATGEYPTFTLHDTRSHLQTKALTLGVSEAFLDVLAGRTSGAQSAHYDLRTPSEIVKGSIEGFDPNDDSRVVGPVAVASLAPEVVNRQVFLFQNAAPKQVTEVGGCSTSWSLNPCDQHGDCMRCGKSVWRKGDQRRLPTIRAMHQHSIRMIKEGERRLQAGAVQEPIKRHIRQHQSVRARCEQILLAESDPSIPIGTLVTFSAAPEAQGLSELTSRLREGQISDSTLGI